MKIEKLAPSARVEGRWLCHLEDGSILRVGESEVVSFALYTGKELTDEELTALEGAVEARSVREKALTLVTGRSMSRKELVDKLTARPRDEKKKPVNAEQAEAAAYWLTELGYLNDAEYARAVARHYAAKGYGERRVRDELWKRGVPRELWDEALEETGDAEEPIDAFVRRRLRGTRPDPRELKRLSDALLRRGFDWEDIRAALGRYADGMEEE